MERPEVVLGPIIADNILAKKCPGVSDCSIMTIAVAQWIMENEELLNETATVSRDNELRRKLAAIFKTLGQKHKPLVISNGFEKWLDSEISEVSDNWDINDTTWLSPIALYFSQNKGENQLYKCIEATCLAASTICQNTQFIECAKALATCVYYLSLDLTACNCDQLLYNFLEKEFGYDIPDFSDLSPFDINKYIDADLLPLAVSYGEDNNYFISSLEMDRDMIVVMESDLSSKYRRKLYRLIITMAQAACHSVPNFLDWSIRSKEFLPTELLEIHDRFVYNFLNSEYYFWEKSSRRTLIDKILGRNKNTRYKYICKDGTIIESNVIC